MKRRHALILALVLASQLHAQEPSVDDDPPEPPPVAFNDWNDPLPLANPEPGDTIIVRAPRPATQAPPIQARGTTIRTALLNLWHHIKHLIQ